MTKKKIAAIRKRESTKQRLADKTIANLKKQIGNGYVAYVQIAIANNSKWGL